MTYEHLATSCKAYQPKGWLELHATLLISKIYDEEKDSITFYQPSFTTTKKTGSTN